MLGKYRIIRELGRGAMGVVYEAFDTTIERQVAIKTIKKSAVNPDEAEEVFARFRSEARAAGRVSHATIINIYEYGETDELAYIVMELVRGKEMSAYVNNGQRLPVASGLGIVMQILDALDYLHAHGIVHRDIKPANIMITADGQVKIADFGIAKIDSSGHTQVGVVLGTPTYMAPEQFMGHQVDQRADLYAAGVILYLMLTGVRPFVGSVIAIMHQAVHREVPLPSSVNPDSPKQLDAIVRRAMAKQPEDRYQSAQQFLKALKGVAQALSVGADAVAKGVCNAPIVQPSLDETLELPSRAHSTGSWREEDIEAWQRISHSHDRIDFQNYLRKFPDGGFTELARMRIQSLENSIRRIAQEKEKAEAEALQMQAAEERAIWVRKLEEIKKHAESEKLLEARRQEQVRAQQAQRAEALQESLNSRADSLAGAVSEREALILAEKRMKQEARQKLEEEVRRKKQGIMQAMNVRESREARAEAQALAKREQELAELAARNAEVEAAKAKAAQAESLRREVEARAQQEQKKTSHKMLFIGIFLVLLLIGIVLGVLPSSK